MGNFFGYSALYALIGTLSLLSIWTFRYGRPWIIVNNSPNYKLTFLYFLIALVILFLFHVTLEASGVHRAVAYTSGGLTEANPECIYVKEVRDKVTRMG